ncbi:hypothetical protein AURDEDRAFT_182028 [Auricularia subglabra TFB-10046 SS5]|nr:hypothetical protein AURDEDRAFT_182028 [Auricularia subglabra TFB-10046 SS5]
MLPDQVQAARPAAVRLFSSPPVYDTLFTHCMGSTSPACLARALPAAQAALEDYTTRSYHQRLLRYVPDPWEFRSMQARTGGLVSGSLPLQVLSAEDYGTDLDVYPWPGTEGEWGSYLGKQGYTLELKDEPDVSFPTVMARVEAHGWRYYTSVPPDMGRTDGYRGCREVATILPFVKDVTSADGTTMRLQVHLVVSKHSPVATILGFHSNVVMNFVTWNCLYCLFPRTNFEEWAMIVLRPDKHMESEAVFKYILRGFTKRYTFPSDARAEDLMSDATGSELSMTRWVGDRYTWTISLFTDGVVAPTTPHVDVTLYGFTLQQMSPTEPPDSDRDSPAVERLTSGHIRVLVDTVYSVPFASDGLEPLSVPYTAPHDFSHTLNALHVTSQRSGCRACHEHVFDRQDEVGRDGAMRMAKLTYKRNCAGKFDPMPMVTVHLAHRIAQAKARREQARVKAKARERASLAKAWAAALKVDSESTDQT